MPITVLHISAALLSVLLGAMILLARKVTPRHRQWGRIYGVALLVTVTSSFFVTDLRHGWSVFHAVSVLTGLLVLCGWWQPVFGRSRAGWVRRHMLSMQLSYLVLIVTGTAQFFDYLPLPNDALNAIVFLQLPLMVGIVAIIRRSRRPFGTHGSLPSSP